MALTKKDIIEKIAESANLPMNKSTHLVESVIEILKSCLENGEDVLISGFGKFCVKEKKQRKGRNPATGEDLMISARKVLVFRCSGLLRDRINKK